MFRFFRAEKNRPGKIWYAHETFDGVRIVTEPEPDARPLTSVLIGGWLEQLEEEGYTLPIDGGVLLPWDAVYSLKGQQEHDETRIMLELPPIRQISCSLSSRGSLEDSNFSIAISDWRIETSPTNDAFLQGAVLTCEGVRVLLAPANWALFREVKVFALRDTSERNGQAHRLAWGRIRRLAVAASANLDSFLHKTVVLTPEKLEIGFRKSQVGSDTVVELQPTFAGAPADWLERFDRQSSVQERYDIPTEDGVVQIVISPKVSTVLKEMKRLPNRRVAGVRAQAFALNPYAVLGPDANEVIDEEQFETARSAAGLGYERFLPQFERDELGYPQKVGLLIETASMEGLASSETVWLDDSELASFITALKRALDRDFQLLAWRGFDLELQGDVQIHLRDLEEAQTKRQQPQVLISYDHVYDLTHYASRIQEIGFEKPYYSPYIAKKVEGDGWFPENLINIISWVPEGESQIVSMPISPEALRNIEQELLEAEAAGRPDISVTGTPTRMPVAEARRVVETFRNVLDDARNGTLDPRNLPAAEPISPAKRKSPVIRSNIQGVDYIEERRNALSTSGHTLQLPSSLRAEIALLPHQQEGVAWLQTLFEAHLNYNCRGAVLADDMGLGKTLQLLTLMAWAIEKDSEIAPMLVVAPVSLLENWKEEVDKFFVPGSLPLLTAYGEGLTRIRVPRENIDERLRNEDGLTKFLKPGWLGSSRIVLTTYETLRDLEFSFAAQKWSMMICDEAQKIKNPAAMVTRAAKKQNVDFKIACTGTPVENTLADLWCLFDFVQPGLLGALNEFGRQYRRPIEARTDEEKAKTEELRRLIEPQILRRTKSEVAKDLPKKIVVEACRTLPLSMAQRKLYSEAIELFKQRNNPGATVPFKNHLGLLHYLRLICTDPRRHGLTIFQPEPLSEYRRRAPKLHWLLTELAKIQKKDEKVIVFCEFRNIQRLLQYYIDEVFEFKPDIINGDTTTSTSHSQSRQKRLRAFQQKPGFSVIILSPIAVGFGVNIQAANHVVHYTRTWNPAKEDQATDRAYRIGQKKDVYVYYPVVCADDFTTFDVRLDQLLASKRILADDMLNGAGELSPGEFNIEDASPPGTSFEDELITLEAVRTMEWAHFEALITALYAKRGYDARLTPGSRDNGIDVVALPRSSGSGLLVQAKSSGAEGRKLNWEAIKEVVGGRAFYSKQYPSVKFDLVCITNQSFNEQAKMNARINNVELIEQLQLTAMLEDTPVTMRDVERILYPSFQ